MSSRTKVRPQTPRVATASVPTKARKPRRVSIPSAAQDTAPSHAAPARAATGGRERDVTEGVPDGEELAESSAWIRAIYDGFPEHLGLLTPDGTLLDANRAAFDFYDVHARGGRRLTVLAKLAGSAHTCRSQAPRGIAGLRRGKSLVLRPSLGPRADQAVRGTVSSIGAAPKASRPPPRRRH